MPTTPSRSSDPTPVQYSHPSAPQIGNWIRHNVLTTTPDNGKCYKLIVRHLSVNGKPNGDVGTVKIDDDIQAIDGIEQLIQDVCEMAQGDANAMREGLQRYAVYAYFDKNRDYVVRTPFRVNAEEAYDSEAGEGEGSEPASEKGLLAQLMRHTEAQTRITTIHTNNIIETLMRDNASQRALIEKQMGQAVDMAAVIQESLDNSTARRIAEKEAATNGVDRRCRHEYHHEQGRRSKDRARVRPIIHAARQPVRKPHERTATEALHGVPDALAICRARRVHRDVRKA